MHKKYLHYMSGFTIGLSYIFLLGYSYADLQTEGGIGVLFDKLSSPDSNGFEPSNNPYRLNGENITDKSITNKELADNSIGGENIIDNSIGSADITNDSITSIDIKNSSIESGDIKNGTLTSADIHSNYSLWKRNPTTKNIFYTDGNVGIGTENPSQKLEVAGKIQSTSPTGTVTIGSTNPGYAHLTTDRPSFYFNKQTYINGNLRQYGANKKVMYDYYCDRNGNNCFSATSWKQYVDEKVKEVPRVEVGTVSGKIYACGNGGYTSSCSTNGTYNWFQSIDSNVELYNGDGVEIKLITLSGFSRESDDWPLGSYNFCKNKTDNNNCSYNFNTEYKLHDSNSNKLWLTVNVNNGKVILKYRGYDGSADLGGTHFNYTINIEKSSENGASGTVTIAGVEKVECEGNTTRWYSECTAECPKNTVLTGGSCNSNLPEFGKESSKSWKIISNFPTSNNSWYCKGGEDHGSSVYNKTITGYAMCATLSSGNESSETSVSTSTNTPPECSGENKALQFKNGVFQCITINAGSTTVSSGNTTNSCYIKTENIKNISCSKRGSCTTSSVNLKSFTGKKLSVTLDFAGSSWGNGTHTYTFEKGKSETQTFRTNNGNKKFHDMSVIYNASNNSFYAYGKYAGASSKVKNTAINVTSVGYEYCK